MEENVRKCLDNNPNLSADNRTVIYEGLCNIKNLVHNCYQVNINFDNISQILSTVKIIDVDDADSYFSYSRSDNQIIRKKTDDKYMIFDFYSSLLRLISQRYDFSANKYNSGLLIEDENGTRNSLLNDELISRLTTLLTRCEDRKRVDVTDKEDGTSIQDIIINDMSETVGIQNLLTYFFDARGIEFYESLAEIMSEEEANDFISIVDRSRDRSDIDSGNRIPIEKRKKYDAYIALMKEKLLEVIPKL